MAIEQWSVNGPWELLNCDCLGCLMDARNAGVITDDEYADILREQNAEPQRALCPQCGASAYVSEYEPDLAHCPTCGLYSVREQSDDDPEIDVWVPFRQGGQWNRHERATRERLT